MEEKRNINSKDQKKVDQANNHLQLHHKEVRTKFQDKLLDQPRLQIAIKEVDKHQDSQQVDKIILEHLKQLQMEAEKKRNIDFQDLKRERRINKEMLHLDLLEVLVIQKHQLQKV